MATHYKVRSGSETVTKDVDFSKRIVQSIANTLLYFDHDQDVLMVGCANKSIQERGPDSNAKCGKIKNVKDHKISERIGKPIVTKEDKLDGKTVLYCESKMAETTIGNDALIEYQEGIIDQHSIGHRYVDLDFISADDEEWNKFLSMLINPEDAEEYGYAFRVKEIEWFEWSPVSFGANELTAYLGVKSNNKDALLLKIFDRLDLINKSLRNGSQSDEAMRDYELEVMQIKQIMTELFNKEPSVKDTIIKQINNGRHDREVFDVSKAVKETNFEKFLKL